MKNKNRRFQAFETYERCGFKKGDILMFENVVELVSRYGIIPMFWFKEIEERKEAVWVKS